MLQAAYRHVVLPAYETVLHRRKNFRYWKDLERSQWLSRTQIEQIQFDNLKRLVEHAYANCPYYRDAWSSLGLSPATLKEPADIRRWPVTGRADVVTNRMRMRAQSPNIKLITKTTSGSTGAPLTIDYDTGSEERRYGAWYRGYAWGGAAPGTKQLWFWGAPMGPRPAVKRWKDKLYAGIYRRHVINCFDLNERTIPGYLEFHNRYKPDAIVAYTSAVYAFAREVERLGLKAYSPRSIVVGAEKLYDSQRELLQRVFGCPVFETYGSREFMLTGAECERHEGLHLTAEHLLVEVLDDDGNLTPDGEEGNLVITDLFNYGMPMVRYKNNDRAIAGWKQCSCGRGLPVLHAVTGRVLDVVLTPDGRRVPGEFFPYVLNNFPLKRYQVTQDAPDHFECRLVKEPEWTEAHLKKVSDGLRAGVGDSINFDIVFADDIPLSKSGKFQVVINKVAGGAGRAPSASSRELASVG